MMSFEGFSTENFHIHNLLATDLVKQFGLNIRPFAQ